MSRLFAAIRGNSFLKLMVLFPYVSTVVIAIFGVSRLLNGEYAIAVFDFFIAGAFLALGTYTLLTGRETASRFINAVVVLAGTIFILSASTASGIFWVYSSSVVLYYLVPLRWAIGMNVVMLSAVAVIYQSAAIDAVQFYTFVSTVGLINFFSITFKELTERSIRDRVELEEAQRQVEQLRELLPICASCHKIRDEGGGWQQMEIYLTEYRATSFSHGICPECAEDLYESGEL